MPTSLHVNTNVIFVITYILLPLCTHTHTHTHTHTWSPAYYCGHESIYYTTAVCNVTHLLPHVAHLLPHGRRERSKGKRDAEVRKGKKEIGEKDEGCWQQPICYQLFYTCMLHPLLCSYLCQKFLNAAAKRWWSTVVSPAKQLLRLLISILCLI